MQHVRSALRTIDGAQTPTTAGLTFFDSMRQKYPTRSIILSSEGQRELAVKTLHRAPIDADKPLEWLLREEVKTRKLDQNALMWVGALKDIEQQIYVQRKMHSDEVWHIYFKERYLPEQHIDGVTKEGYQKWAYLPNEQRRLIGSTTELTIYGFSLYLNDIHAFGGNRGVEFSASARQQLDFCRTEGSKQEVKRKQLYKQQ
jgi:hypothetical protein